MSDPSQQLQQTLLEQLRDVHMPSPVQWWPPAIGWWLLTALALIALLITVKAIRKHYKKNAYRRTALAELQGHYQQWQEDQQTASYLQNANAILKRCILSRRSSSEAKILSQSGRQWLATLQNLSPQSLSVDAELALSELCYQAQPNADIDQLHAELSHWIRNHRLARRHQAEHGTQPIKVETNHA